VLRIIESYRKRFCVKIVILTTLIVCTKLGMHNMAIEPISPAHLMIASQVKVKVTLRPMASQSVCFGVKPKRSFFFLF
jgi:hypothetical protein